MLHRGFGMKFAAGFPDPARSVMMTLRTVTAALSLPATILRGLLAIPTAIVNVMERHGTGK